MRTLRYERRGRITIDAPIDHVYWTAVHPDVVPQYADEIRRIKVLRESPRGVRWVQSYIRIGGLTIPFHYRYRYSPPHFYGGVQARAALVRGYFAMRLRALGDRSTEVEHVEGAVSRIPLLAQFVGWVWFTFVSRLGVDDELLKLKRLVEKLPDAPRALPRAQLS
jgi:hypothetical protein